MDSDDEKEKVYEESTNASDYWSKVVRGEEEFDTEDDDEDEVQKDIIFKCNRCGFMYDTKNPPKYIKMPLENYIIQSGVGPLKIKCPNCGKTVLFDTVTRDKYEKEVQKKEEKKQKEEEKKNGVKARDAEKQIREDLSDLLSDLKKRLFAGEISPKRFVAIASYGSRNILKRYNKYVNVDWLDFRKSVYELSDGVLKTYNANEKSEDIIEEYTDNIEEDELYLAQMEYYIDDNQFALPDYELRQRIREYDRQESKLQKEEYEKGVVEKYQKRKNELLQKAEERKRKQKIRNIL